eukprot:m.192086 g.192086  ORF g.192086 m.192086 type:complete len:679 (+) comp39463_c0_seq4:228-2264(+)
MATFQTPVRPWKESCWARHVLLQEYLFYAMEFVGGGDLLELIRRRGPGAPRLESRFYVSEILVALQYLHSKGVVYRDLKMENVLIDKTGHVKLCDMGVAKECLHVRSGRTKSVAGTLLYTAPEVLLAQPYNESTDYWSLGVLAHELVLGHIPFQGEDFDGTCHAIVNTPLNREPLQRLSYGTRDFITKLLHKNPTRRLGMIESTEPIRCHRYFETANWDEVEARRLRPPFLPEDTSVVNAKYFPEEFTSKTPELEPAPAPPEENQLFQGFEYTAENVLEEHQTALPLPSPTPPNDSHRAVSRIRHGPLDQLPGAHGGESQPTDLLLDSATNQSIENFDLLKVLGSGQFSKVFAAQSKLTGEKCAIKAVKKTELTITNNPATWIEKRALLLTRGHLFFIHLMATFQNKGYLFYVMELALRGDLFTLCIENPINFTEQNARFYLSESIVAIQFIHSKGVIHRDVKLENILIARTGHIKLCDLGLAKECLQRGDGRTNTSVGTPCYMAPEIILGSPYNESVDFWSLGVIAHLLVTKIPPFHKLTEISTATAILKDPFEPPWQMSTEMKDFVSNLLCKEPNERLGTMEIRSHPFLECIDWDMVEDGRLIPPFFPKALELSFFEASQSPFQLDAVHDDYDFQGFDWTPEIVGDDSSRLGEDDDCLLGPLADEIARTSSFCTSL